MTQLIAAENNDISSELKFISEYENISEKVLLSKLKQKEICIVKNKKKKIEPIAIGSGLKTKINANIGTSKDCQNVKYEIEKLKIAVKYGADAIMDLSTGGDLVKIREIIISECPVPVGTVPIYDAASIIVDQNKNTDSISKNMLFDIIEKHGEQGVDFITVHCGVTKSVVEKLDNNKRILSIVSRGGSILAHWIKKNQKENPLFEYYDELLDIAFKYDMVLSLGDGLRPGCLKDATDAAQVEELIILGELAVRAWEKGVQVMIEGPGHVPLNQVELNIKLQKQLCHNAPFYVLGPLVTDIAPGYDHITSAIGGAIAAAAGADFLCYVTPAEHLRLPSIEDVKQGVIASKIAAHAADIAKNVKGASEQDEQMARARYDLDWNKQIECSIDPELVKKIRDESNIKDDEVCSMCSDLCAIKKLKDIDN